MRILVIGGTSFMGPHVVRRLLAGRHEVAVLTRGETEAELPDGVQRIRGNRRTPGTVAQVVGEVRPERVLDMVMLTEADARDLVAAVAGRVERLTVASSIDVYRTYGKFHRKEQGPPEPMPLTEDSPLRQKLYPYRADPPRPEDAPDAWMDDYDKIPAEAIVMSTEGVAGTVLRLPMVYGPDDRQHRTRDYLRRMDRGRPAILLDETWANWRGARGYVENMADAIVLCLLHERAAGRIYHVAESPTVSEREWVEAIGAAAGWSGRVLTAPREQVPRHLDPGVDARHHLAADSTRIREELGFGEAVPVAEALRRTIAWEREQSLGDDAEREARHDAAEDDAIARLEAAS